MTITAQTVAAKLRTHVETVSPGQPAALTLAHQPPEGIWQGDLWIGCADVVPADYVQIKRLTDVDRQLVPLGGGPGSNHRLKSLRGVKLYRPPDWGKSPTDLRGPALVITEDIEIVHEPGHSKPHGTVTVEGPRIVVCEYQRNLTVEERVIRAAD